MCGGFFVFKNLLPQMFIRSDNVALFYNTILETLKDPGFWYFSLMLSSGVCVICLAWYSIYLLGCRNQKKKREGRIKPFVNPDPIRIGMAVRHSVIDNRNTFVTEIQHNHSKIGAKKIENDRVVILGKLANEVIVLKISELQTFAILAAEADIRFNEKYADKKMEIDLKYCQVIS
jgi:hypothetical protein